MAGQVPCPRARARFGRTAAVLLALGMAASTPARAQTVGNCTTGIADAYLDIGNVRARILNNGNLFGDQPYEYNIPKGSPSNAMYSSSLWLAGKVDGDLRVAATTFGPFEYWPGPLDESGNPPADCALYDRLWKISKADVEAYETTGTPTEDLADWPTGLGAPTVDASGNEVDLSSQPLAVRIDRPINLDAGERPAFVGDQMIWWIMNDMGGAHERTKTDPLVVEVHGLAFAFEAPGHVGNTTFYRYAIMSRRPDALTDVYVGIFSDVDVGDFSDDYVGSDSLLSLAYAYNGDRFDGGSGGYGAWPPAIGFDVLEGPIVPSPGDIARVGSQNVSDYRNLQATTILGHGNGGALQSDPNKALDFYYYMQGIWKDGTPMTVGGSGYRYTTSPTHFIFSGDAAHCAYWTECKQRADRDGASPFGDRRLEISSGPFVLDAGARQEIVFGVVYGRGSDHLDSVTELKSADMAVQRFFDSGFTVWPEVPAAPTKPVIAGSPGDGVTGRPLSLRLEWECPADALYCRMQWDDDPAFESPTEVIYASSADLELTPQTEYWWRIRGVGRGEMPGPWSAAWSFSTGDLRNTNVIRDFRTVSNAGGPLDPPECAVFTFNGSGFSSLCGSDRPNPARQQITAQVSWGIHAGGAGIPFGPATDPKSFVGVVTRGRGVLNTQASSDWEIRFTTRGGRALRQNGAFMDVPFEAWRTGRDTPGDPGDDTRLLPVLVDNNTAGVFDVGGDHQLSGGSNDPVTDWMTFRLPDIDGNGTDDLDPGEAGYEAWIAGTGGAGSEVWANLVLVCLNCGAAAPFPAPHPEIGTTFRIVTAMPEPAILAAPAPGFEVPAGEVRFHWSAQADVSNTLQVASDPGFVHLVTEVPAAASGLTIELEQPGAYWWRVGRTEFGWSEPWSLNVLPATAVESGFELPTEFALDAIWPNPFNPLATIRFGLPADAVATVDVVDVLGRRVAVIDAGARRAAGWHTVQFDGSRLASGVYFVRLVAGGRIDVKSVVLLK